MTARARRVQVVSLALLVAHLGMSIGAALAAEPAALAALAAPGEPSNYWVFFQDRGPDRSLDSTPAKAPAEAGVEAEAAKSVTPRALERRLKAIRERGEPGLACTPVDERDLEPDAGYVAAVEKAGSAIRMQSRWLNAVSVEGTPTTIAAIRALPFVLEIRPVALLSRDAATMADEFSYGSAAHQLEMIGVPEAHVMGYRGEGVLVGVLDSGFDLGHEAFDQLSVRAQRDFLFNDEDPSFDPSQDDLGQSDHGTMVLSVIAGYMPGRIVGPAFRAEYLLAKTELIGSEVRIEEDAWCAAVEWAEAMGADVLTSSLSYRRLYRAQDMDGRTAVISRAANIAFERGLLIVNSIGNDGPGDGSLSPPADAPGVIAVGAVDRNGRISGFSSAGPTWDRRVKPDLVAMGSGVAHVTARTRDRYGRGAGTSYSAPLVAGCAALVLSAHPDWGPEAVREAVIMSSDRASRPDNRYGWGVPNVRDAILYPCVEGKVIDAVTREPLAGARVLWGPAGRVDSTKAETSGSPVRGILRTDSLGTYIVPNLPRGSYRISIEADGYFGSESQPIEVPPSLGDLTLALRYRGE